MPKNIANPDQTIRHDWQLEQVESLYALPFADLMFRAQTLHRANFDPNVVQVSTVHSLLHHSLRQHSLGDHSLTAHSLP